MGLINGSVYLENNYELWKEKFYNEKIKLENIFNNGEFTIEHVGSTAVKGLSAKPIVDIAIGVQNLDDINPYISKLAELYTIKENHDSNEILLIDENKKETNFLIHVMLINSIRYKNMIIFRDILNSNPIILKQYENLKIELAMKYSNDRKMYTKSKNDFIQNILKNTNN